MQDLVRINNLIDAAAKNCGGSDNKLAAAMSTSRQVISNWRHGHKSPSVEAQAELAYLAGCNVAMVVMYALIENASGPRLERLQSAVRAMSTQQEPRRVMNAEEAGEGLVAATWRRPADVIKSVAKFYVFLRSGRRQRTSPKRDNQCETLDRSTPKTAAI